jgi:hypothetical protein
MANQDLHINSALLAVAKPSQKNMLTELGRGLKDFGKVKNQQYDRQLQADNKTKQDELVDMQLESGHINMQAIKDTVADSQVIKSYIKSDYGDANEYLADNNITLKTLKAQEQIDALSDKKMIKFWDDELVANEKYLRDNKKFLTKDGTIDMPNIRKQLGNGSHHLQLSQAFERKYNTKLYNIPKDKKPLSLSDQIKLNNLTKEDSQNKLLENDLKIIEINNQKLFNKPLTTAQKIAYKKNGELPYLEYGSKDLNTKRKGLIDANIEIEKALGQLDQFTFEEIDEVAGWIQGMNPIVSGKDAVNKLTKKQKQIRTILGHINSDKMHEIYGSALTGGEVGRSKTWNLDLDQSTTSLLVAINQLRHKNAVQFKNNTYGVNGVPSDNMTFGQFKIPDKEDKTKKEHIVETNQTAPVLSREDKIKFLMGN